MNNKKFDLNTVIGLLLIGGIFLYFGFYNQPEVPPEEISSQDSSEVVDETRDFEEKKAEVPFNDTDTTVVNALGATGTEATFYTLENELLELTISSRGGQVVKARLKKYRTYDSLPLYLINENTEFNIMLEGEEIYNTGDLNFTASNQSDNSVTMTLNAGSGRTLEYRYSLSPSNYMLDWDIRSSGMAGMLGDNTGLQWEMKTLRHEKNRDNEATNTHLEYRYSDDDDVDNLSAGGQDSEELENIKWVAYKQQFFSSILLQKEADFDRAALASQEIEEDVDFTKVLVSKVQLSGTGDDLDVPLGLYLGPNKYEVLNAYGQDFDELIPLGWGILGWINRGIVINIFNWLEGYGLNYGLIILIIALIIKIAIFPLTYTSYRSMAKMRVLKPEIDELNEKYKDKDPMKKQQATMQLYQKAGVNPLGGCIPLLFQMPILIALFQFFPSSIELRQQSFLWAEDLSTYDSIASLPFTIPFYGDHVSLFTLLMTVSTLIYTYMNQQLTGQNQQYPQLKYMMYLMPVVFLGVFNSYAAGLSYYYFVANVITFGQQFIIRATLDDEKIHAKIQAKKEQPRKENRLMRRMRELQEDQNRQARRKKK